MYTSLEFFPPNGVFAFDLKSFIPELNNWPWYVDDSVLKCRRPKAQVILNHLNDIEPEHIKFAMMKEKDNIFVEGKNGERKTCGGGFFCAVGKDLEKEII